MLENPADAEFTGTTHVGQGVSPEGLRHLG
jgi:hypothetical protein